MSWEYIRKLKYCRICEQAQHMGILTDLGGIPMTYTTRRNMLYEYQSKFMLYMFNKHISNSLVVGNQPNC